MNHRSILSISLLDVLLLMWKAKGQIITLNYITTSTSCSGNELLEGNDFIVLNGTVDLQTANANDWKLDIPIQYSLDPLSGLFETICTVYMIDSCTNDGSGCYCISQSGGIYNFMYNKTATKTLSGATMQAELSRLDTTDVKRDTAAIPIVYGQENINLTMNGSTINIESCDLTLKKNEQYSFTFCASNLKAPQLSIQFSAANLQVEKSQCITRSITTPSDSTIQNFTLAYMDENCSRSKTYTCFIIKAPSSVDNTGLIVGVVVGVGSCLLIAGIVIAVLIYKKEKPKCSDSKIILVIVVTVAGSVVIVGIVIGLLFYCNVCKFKKANKQPTGLNLAETKPTTTIPPARHIETKKPLTPLAHLPPYKISPISGKNEKASNLTESNETPNDSTRKKKSKKKRARRKIENGGKNDEQ